MRNISKEILELCVKNPIKKVFGYHKNWYKRDYIYHKTNDCILRLREFNIQKGDRIIYKGGNSMEWLCWNIATHQLGCIWVPIYREQSISYDKYIIEDSSPKLLITDKRIKKNTYSIPTILNTCHEEKNYDNLFSSYRPHDISTLIYTSGTSGGPKGVILTHDNILSNIDSIHKMFHDLKDEKSISILPWSHIYGQTCELYYNLLKENETYISSDKNKFIKDCYQEKPTVLFLVPRILDILRDHFIKNKMEWLAPYLLKKMLGGKVKIIFSGGASLSKETRDFFHRSGILICEGYGCSETSPMISLNHWKYPRMEDSVGSILDGINIKIIDGEICIQGPNVFQGYWNKVPFKEEWYKTGDYGSIKDNFLYYKGRKSENYKLSNGKFIDIFDLEKKIKPFLPNSHFIVHGEDYNYLITTKNISEKEKEEINQSLEKYEKIKKVYTIMEKEMSNFLTLKMSIKRKELVDYIIKNYK